MIFKRLRPTIRTALFGLVGIPLTALFLELAYDTNNQSQVDIAEAYLVATAINDITGSQTEQFLSRAEYILTELSRRPQVRALDRANCDPLLADWKRLQPAYANILTLDANGLLVCSATGIQPGQAAGPDPKYYFAETVRTGEFTVGKPAKGFVTGRWVSTLAYPIRNGDGQVIGVVAASVDLAQFQSFAPTGKLKADGVVGIINGEGTIIARSKEAEQRVGRVSDAESAKIMLAQRRGVLRSRDYKGADRLYAFTSIPRSDWIAFTSLNTAAVLAPAQRLALERLALAIAVMFAITALTLWASRRISKPVEALSKTIMALTEGDSNARPTADGPLEIYQIAVKFSVMLDALALGTESLRANRAKLDAALDSMSDAVFISDTQGRFIHFNEAFATYHKFRNREECAKTLAEYPMFLEVYSASGELLPLEQWAVPRALRGETAANVEFTLKRIDTGETWIGSYNYAPIHGKDGAIVGSVVTGRDITEHKRLERAIVASEKEFRLLAEAMPQIVWITRADGANIYFNRRWVDYTGLTLEESCGDGWNKPFHPEDRQRAWDAWQEAVHHNRTYALECRLRRADGQYLWWLIRGVPVLEPGGAIEKWFGTCTDIQEIKTAQEATRQREAEYRSLFESMTAGFVVFEVVQDDRGVPVDLVVIAANKGFESTIGLNVQDVTGKRLTQVLPGIENDAADWIGTFGKVGVTGEPQQLERLSELLGASYAVSAYQSGPKRCAVTFTDVTVQKQARESQRIAATAFESRQGMFITNAESVILQVNKAFTEITGYTPEQAVGKTPRLLGSGRHDAAFYAAMWDVIERTGEWHGEIWNRRMNGTIYPENLNISAVRNEDGAATHYVGSFRDLTATKAAEEQIETLAFSDQLTGLPNRRMLMVQLQQVMLASEHDKRQGALLLVDLDNFKDLNDALGHGQGDLLLQQFGERLSACAKEGETVARVGGDEFVVLLTQLASSPLEAAMYAETVANKILAALRQPYGLGGSEIACSASIGVALFGARHEDAVEPLKRAELAMYEAKGHGRNTLRFFDPKMQDAVNARVAMEAALRQAIEAHQFVLYYQAQVSDQGRITGVEALLRWPDPKRGMVSPAEFIPLAEATGLILPIGLWVLESACKQLAQWARQPGLAHLTVAVNVSAKQFHQRDFVDQVLITLARTGANPARLKIELTETVLVANVDDVIAKMSALKGRGVGFSIDDFGTGYSSLAYLKRLPLDQLKIDQGFIRDILIDPDDAAIAKMVVALADSLGLEVIAEGVETQAQRDFLADLGCRNYQGYLFCKPMLTDEFEAFARQI